MLEEPTTKATASSPAMTMDAISRPEEPGPLLDRLAGGSRRLWLVCAILVMVTLMTGAISIAHLRQNAFATTQRELTNLGTVLAEQTSRTIQSVDLILQEAQLRVAEQHPVSPDDFGAQMSTPSIHEFLAQHSRNMPQVEAISVIGADGKMRNWSRDTTVNTQDFSGRDYFLHLRDHNDPGLFISTPSAGRISGKWIMVVARRISAQDGTFLGLVIGVIDTHYLEDFYQTISMLPGEAVRLIRRDGIVVAGFPDVAARRGQPVSTESPWYDFVAAGGGSFRSKGHLTGFKQIVTVHPLRDYPLVVDVNMAEQAALHAWYKQATGLGIATVGIAVGFGLLFGVIVSQFERMQRQNVSLHQRAAALRQSERRLTSFAEMAADWFWEQDADCRIVRYSGVPRVVLPTDFGKRQWDFADPAMSAHRWDAHKADIAARRPFRDFRWERIDAAGKKHYISTSGDPIFDEDGNFTGYRGTGRDITRDVEAAEELRVAKERAESANRAKSEFLTNMSHELRTPLHAIIGFGELIHDQTSGPLNESYVEWAGEILNSGRHLLDMIIGLLELSKIETGRYELLEDQVDLSAIARACLKMVRLQADAKQVCLDSALEPAGPDLLADRRAIKQIILNLLTNAVKFTPSGGTVSLGTEPTAEGGAALVVVDTGIGIAPDALKTLGEPFTQADASIRRRFGGTGLGLAISSRLATLHGGVLTIESILSEGTTVRVEFPASRVSTETRTMAFEDAAIDPDHHDAIS